MRLIIQTHSTNEFSEGCEFAYLDFTPDLVEQIMERKKLFDDLLARDSGLQDLVFYSCEPIYFTKTEADADEDDEVIELFDNDQDYVDVTSYAQSQKIIGERTEGDRLVISSHGFYWMARPKHCDWSVETREIAYSVIQEVTANA